MAGPSLYDGRFRPEAGRSAGLAVSPCRPHSNPSGRLPDGNTDGTTKIVDAPRLFR
ncbi:hypothetical protein EDF70_104360 [Neorhizobium sp. JUb45]|nr:hypothetical protein EDF70_104360 [Neorhizobium sp. JUb45]